MKERIRQAFKSIRLETLQRVRQDFVKRLHICAEQGRNTFEHLMCKILPYNKV
ncbi:hypothetical protein BDFB_015086 [Asbolus verrucosus]|uniref:Uncharacterized protein n=1 Tax=Asbolus verrucosus TaxID=1661398 RepID=A0A482W917_ASBVE|nr:hypothetical protein BDFB_015086 [Asbolus verrucosus]